MISAGKLGCLCNSGGKRLFEMGSKGPRAAAHVTFRPHLAAANLPRVNPSQPSRANPVVSNCAAL